MNNNNEKIILAPSMRRFVWASLYVFEKSLRKSKRLLEENGSEGFLYKRSLSLNSTERNHIQEKLDTAFQKLKLAADKLGLEQKQEISEKMILAEMSMSWANLVECRAGRVRGYGEIDPISAKAIDAAVAPLAEISSEISKMVTKYMEESNGEN